MERKDIITWVTNIHELEWWDLIQEFQNIADAKVPVQVESLEWAPGEYAIVVWNKDAGDEEAATALMKQIMEDD